MHVFQIELTALKRFYLEIRFGYILLKVGKYDKVQLSAYQYVRPFTCFRN